MAADRVYEIEYRVDARAGVAELGAAKRALADVRLSQEELRVAIAKYGATSSEARAAQERLTASTASAKAATDAAAASTAKATQALARYAGSSEATDLRVRKFAAAQGRLGDEVRKASVELAKASVDADKLGSSVGRFAEIGGAVTAVKGFAGAAQGVARFAAEAGTELAQLKIAAAAVPFEIDSVRDGLLKLVDSTSLTFVASKALQGGLATSREDFKATGEAAAKLSLSIGGTAQEGIEAFYGAISTGSTEVLDNLGITLRLSEAQDEYAERLGKSTAALTDEEKAAAFAVIAKEKLIERAAQLDVAFTSAELSAASLAASIANLEGFLKSVTAYALEATFALGEVTASALAAAAVWVSDQLNERNMLESGLSLVESTKLRLQLQQQEQAQVIANIEAVIELQKELAVTDADLKRLGLDGLKQGDIRTARSKLDDEEAERAGREMGPRAEDFEEYKREKKARQDRAKRGKAAADKAKREAEADERRVQGLLSGSFSEGNTADAVAEVNAYLAEGEALALAKSEEAHARRLILLDERIAAEEEGSAAHLALLEERHLLDLEALERKRSITTDEIELERLVTDAARLESEHRAKLAAIEAKRWKQREQLALKGADMLASSSFAVLDAARESEEGQEVARRRAIAGEARKYQGQLRMIAVAEAVKAVVAAASYNFPGAAAHAAAAVGATAGAVALGQIAGAIEGGLPPAGGAAGGVPAASAPAAERPTGSGATATEIPVSADPTTRGLKTAVDPLSITVQLNVGTLIGDDEAALDEIAVKVQRKISEVAR